MRKPAVEYRQLAPMTFFCRTQQFAGMAAVAFATERSSVLALLANVPAMRFSRMVLCADVQSRAHAMLVLCAAELHRYVPQMAISQTQQPAILQGELATSRSSATAFPPHAPWTKSCRRAPPAVHRAKCATLLNFVTEPQNCALSMSTIPARGRGTCRQRTLPKSKMVFTVRRCQTTQPHRLLYLVMCSMLP